MLVPTGNDSLSDSQVDVPKVVLSLLICIFGLIGNSVAIFIIVVLKEYQKSISHWYVLQLALADSLFLLTLPFKVSEDLNFGFIYPEWMCKAKETILFLNYYSSILFLMILSIDRYIAVCYTLSDNMQKLRKKTTSIIITLITWTVSLLICIPVMLYSFKTGNSPNCTCGFHFPTATNHTARCIEVGLSSPSLLKRCVARSLNMPLPENGELYCNEKKVNIIFGGDSSNVSGSSCSYNDRPNGWKIFLIFNFTVMFVLPLIVMILCYGLIVRRLSATQMKPANTPSTSSFNQPSSRSKSKFKKKRNKSHCRSNKDRRRVTIMSATLVASFLICWLPFHANHLAKIVGNKVENSHICDVLPIVGALLAYFNSALNPFLYSFLGTNFVKKWNNATSTIRKSMRRRRASSSVFGSGRHNQRKQSREGSISTTGTLMTRIHNNSNKRHNYGFETRQSIDATLGYNSEAQHFNAISTVHNDDQIKECSPAITEK